MSEENHKKDHAASEQKIQKSRSDGDDIQTTDIRTAIQYNINLIIIGSYFTILSSFWRAFLDDLSESSKKTWRNEEVINFPPFAFEYFFLFCISLIFGALLVTVAMSVSVSPLRLNSKKIKPKLNRISPISNLHQRFGGVALWSWFLSVMKVFICIIIAFIFIKNAVFLMPTQLADSESSMVLRFKLLVIFYFLLLFGLIQIFFGSLDYFVQRWSYLARLRMTREEVLEEQKEIEGNPEMKLQRRQKGQKIISQSVRKGVADADLVFVNPAHISVGISWRKRDHSLPVICVKGEEEIALLIRELAVAKGVPVIRDIVTARSLFHTYSVNDSIRREHFKVVASAFRYIERLRLEGPR